MGSMYVILWLFHNTVEDYESTSYDLYLFFNTMWWCCQRIYRIASQEEEEEEEEEEEFENRYTWEIN